MTHIKNTALAFLALLLVGGVLQADPIKVTDVAGKNTSIVEILGMEGGFVKIKRKDGTTKLVPVTTFDRESLIRIIFELEKKRPLIQQDSNNGQSSKVGDNKINSNADVLTVAKLKVFGEDYVGKLVQFQGVTFGSISQYKVTRFPQTEIQTDGLLVKYNKKEFEKWIGFSFRDSTGLHSYTIANKSQWGNFILELKSEDRFNILGMVVEMPTSTAFGIIVVEIEKEANSINALKIPNPTLQPPFGKPTVEFQLLRVRPSVRFGGTTLLDITYQVTNHSDYALTTARGTFHFFNQDGDRFIGDVSFSIDGLVQPSASKVFTALERRSDLGFREHEEVTTKIETSLEFTDTKSGKQVISAFEKDKVDVKVTQHPEILKN